MELQSFNLVNTLLFPTPDSSYNIDDFPEELIWVPRNMDPNEASAEDCIPCILLPSPSSRFFLLYLHSNAEDLGRCYTFCSLLRYQFQVHVLAVEYPGYGLCPGGRASEDSVTSNASAALRFLCEVLKWPLDSVMIFGRSIGCGPALALAAEHNVYGVILVCPFLSVRELCRDFVGRLADFIEERFPNKDRVQLVTSPLLLVHGKKDTVVPWAHGRQLYEACTSRKKLVTPDSMHHNTNLIMDANFLVLPMLQFFCLPDYDFSDVRVPDWAFDKRLSPGRLQSCSGAPRDVVGSQNHRSLGVASSSSSSTGGGSPPRKESAESPPSLCQFGLGTSQRRTLLEGRSAQLDHDSSAEEGSTTSSEEVAVAAVQDLVQVKSIVGPWSGEKDLPELLHLASARAWSGLHEAGSHNEADELPEPPEEQGFYKVPRTKLGGPQLLVPEPDARGACATLDWALGWKIPRKPRPPQKVTIQI